MRRISVLSGLAALAILGLTTTASAHPSASPDSVSDHVQRANAALRDFKAAVRKGDERAARGALKRNRRQTNVAAREASSIGGSFGAQAVKKVGRLQARNMGSYVDAFPLSPAGLQLDLTGLIGVAADACDLAADTLESIAGTLPVAARDEVLEAAEIVRRACESALPGVPGSGSVDPLDDILADCHAALEHWTGFVGDLLDEVQSILPIQIPVFGGMLDSLLGIADSACDLLGGIGPIANLPGVGLLDGLLDGILGGDGDGGFLGDILGNLLNGFGFGDLFGGASASGARG